MLIDIFFSLTYFFRFFRFFAGRYAGLNAFAGHIDALFFARFSPL